MNYTGLLLAVQQMSSVEAVMATIMVAFFLYKGGYLVFKKKTKINPRDLLAIHNRCGNYPSMLVILERAMKQSDEIMHIKYIETLYDQMNLADESWQRIRVLLREGFIANLDNTIPSIKRQDAKICYNLVLDKLGKNLIGLIRKWVKRNHFTERTEMEFQTYIKERITDLEEFFSIAIQDIYVPSEMQVDIEALRSFNIKNVMPEIAKELTSFFIKARQIAYEKEQKIKSLKEQLPQ